MQHSQTDSYDWEYHDLSISLTWTTYKTDEEDGTFIDGYDGIMLTLHDGDGIVQGLEDVEITADHFLFDVCYGLCDQYYRMSHADKIDYSALDAVRLMQKYSPRS